MDASDLKSKIKQIIVKELDLRGKTEADIADDLVLFGPSGLGLDSLDALQLATAIEEQFEITVPDDKEHKSVFRSVDTLAAFVQASIKDA